MVYRLGFLLILGIFVSLASCQITLPGLHYDEAFEMLPAVQLLQGLPVTAFRQSAIRLFNYHLPLATQDYIGALNTYGALPFLFFGGITVPSLRLYAISVGVLTLAVVYRFASDLAHNRWAGLAAMALLAVNPTFIFWTRQGVFVTAITALIGAGAAWCWLHWWRDGTYRAALPGAFLFGLGLYAKLLFIWLIAALLGALFIALFVSPEVRQRYSRLFRLSVPQIIGLILALNAGLVPLIFYNLQTGGTFKTIFRNAGTSYYGVNNAEILANLGVRFEQLHTWLSSGHLWYLGGVYPNLIVVFIFYMTWAISLWLAWRHKMVVPLLSFLVIFFVVIQSVITVSNLWVTHYALIMGWPAIALVTTGVSITRRLSSPSKKKKLNYGLGLILALLLITEVNATIAYHRTLAISGGLSSHSDAIYDLGRWLTETAHQPVVAMDWGLAAPITFLTAGQVEVIEVFGYEWTATNRFETTLRPYLNPQSATFLWRAPDEIIFDRSEDFKKLYLPLHLEEEIVQAFYERSGRPILGATRLVLEGEAENSPTVP